ncbi:MAG: YifB family Mg chelatase-like AAA ATPase [Elusimicrobia bacterium]|nr:YifB family Mg chelatase-like AAA ATPase [Elusimicrobiota bacterium]MBD3412366.1 YifB family Mg chelatase-like AAA ATPase [Elusimicrobiota bacterium]
MFSKVCSATIQGINGRMITVEVDVRKGLPGLAIVGLPDQSVREARERVVSAIRNAGFELPPRKITVNLAPAYIKKSGPFFEIPIALGILSAIGIIKSEKEKKYGFVGELALDGSVRPVRGILPMVTAYAEKGYDAVMLPEDNKEEASYVPGIQIYPVSTLRQAVDFLNRETYINPCSPQVHIGGKTIQTNKLDFADVKGQQFAKRALEIAAAGGHNVLMLGPPGAGKTMLAQRMPSILPEMSFEEALEITRIYSVAGLLHENQALMNLRPFRSPHHTISDVALIGGGAMIKPGEISLAHHGVLFMDEFPEFHRNVLEALRQPLEEGKILITRAHESYVYPARFLLIAAMNPCPCGYYGHPLRECRCSDSVMHRYINRISGPLLDRIDLHVSVPALPVKEITREQQSNESSEVIKQRVQSARIKQMERYATEKKSRRIMVPRINAHLSRKQVQKYCVLDQSGVTLIEQAINRYGFSARAYDRIVKIARTIADLDNDESIQLHHIAEAIQYRVIDRHQSGI